ncbi:hypothetical protein [Leucobacter musarum]|uniref:hypothetical protein n=1 Tax=Leucobacter musarum TaxID=1930747 RepID=UPI0012E1C11E|nr:hypothetical protein [Leucobacter musarum]
MAGGQSVYVQAALRGVAPRRPSSDADLVIDVRADGGAARRIVDTLRAVGFEATRRDANGRMHRWQRGAAQIDVLQPRYLGQRAESRLSHDGLETIAAPGAQHLLNRTEVVKVTLGSKSAEIRTPSILGVVIAKAAGFQEIVSDPFRVRHLADILTVAPLIEPADIRAEAPYTRLEKQRVGNAIAKLQKEEFVSELRTWFPDDLDARSQSARRAHASQVRHSIAVRLGAVEVTATSSNIALDQRGTGARALSAPSSTGTAARPGHGPHDHGAVTPGIGM